MTHQLFQLPKETLIGAAAIKPSWKVSFFLTGTTTPTPVYTTSALSTTHTQPVQADSGGVMPAIYLDPSITYKASVYDQNDVLQYTVDPVNDSVLSQAAIGLLLYPRTAAEIAAGVTPTNYAYPPGHMYRYGTNTTPGTTDMSAAIAAMFNSCPAGGEVFLPDELVAFTTGYECSRSITVTGSVGREDFDNSWDAGLGSVLHYRGTAGDGLTFRPPNSGNSRIKVTLRGFIVRGARVSPGSASSGRCVMIDGRQLSGTAIHLDMNRVYCAEAREEGLYITGSVYGSKLSNIGGHDCGKSGIRVLNAGTDPIGEMSWDMVRCFGNGSLGAGDEQAGFRCNSGGTSNKIENLSCSENTGVGAIIQGGSYQGASWQFESNGGASQLYIGSAGGGAGVTNLTLHGFASSPGSNYTGNIINVTSDAQNVKIRGAYFGDTLSGGGQDLQISGPNCSIEGVSTAHTLTYTATDNAYIEGYDALFSATLGADQADVTGDGTAVDMVCETEIMDRSLGYATGTGIFTAKVSAAHEFKFNVILGNLAAAHTALIITLVTSNRSYVYRLNPGAVRTSSDLASFAASYMADMEAGDTAKVTVQVDNSTKTVDIKAGSWFSGARLRG